MKTPTAITERAGGAKCCFWRSVREDARFQMNMLGTGYKGLLLGQGFWALAVYRFGHWNYCRKLFAAHHVLALMHTFLCKVTEVLTGISLARKADIGVPFYIGHFGGIFVNGGARIGKRCIMMQGVTIAENFTGSSKGIPMIGDDVVMSPGCKVVGGITIGNGVRIGANAVVTKSFPDYVLLVGVPAVVKKQLRHPPASEV
jgi:serine O-acetyltransferase